jgi:hypothetical protein
MLRSATSHRVTSQTVASHTRWVIPSTWAFKSTAMIFVSMGQRFLNPWSVQLFREPIQWVDTSHYLGLTRDTQLTWSSHIDYVRKLPGGWVCWVLPWTGDVVSSSGMGFCCTSSSHDRLCLPYVEALCPHPCQEAAGMTVQVSSPR